MLDRVISIELLECQWHMSNLRNARIQRGLTQAELAELIGVSEASISRWERDQHVPVPLSAAKLAQVLNQRLEDLNLGSPSQTFTTKHITAQSSYIEIYDDDLPSLPRLVEREHELQWMRTHIRALRERQSFCSPVVALTGLAGIGKTALATALVYDEEMHQAFPDGVLWAHVGEKPNVAAIRDRWKTLLDPTISLSSQGSLLRQETLKQKMRHRKMCIVLDDIWDRRDALELMIAGPRCIYLITTRIPSLATSLSLDTLMLSSWDTRQSLNWLQMLAPVVTRLDTQTQQMLLEAAGGLPLALTLMGTYLNQQFRDKQPQRLASALASLLNPSDRLSLPLYFERMPRTAISKHVEGSPTLGSLFAQMISRLTTGEQQVLFALSVFPPAPATFSEEAALHIASCSVEALDTLTDSGLLQAQTDRYQMHPLVHAYAAQCLEHSPRSQQHAQKRYLEYALRLLEEQGQQEAVVQREESVVQAALELAWDAHDESSALSLTTWLTSFWLQNHQWEQAEAAYAKAFPAACRHTPRTALSFSLGQGRCLLALHQHEQAIQAYQKTLSLARDHGTQEEQFTLFLQLAAVCIQTPRQSPFQPHVQQAFSCCLEAESLLKQMPAPPLLPSHVQQVLPLLYEMRGTLELWMGAGRQAALEYYHAGLKLAEAFQSIEAWSLLLIMRARACLYGLDYDASEQDLRQALDLTTQVGSSWLVQQCLQGRLDLLLATGRVQEAQAALADLKHVVSHPHASNDVLPHERFCSLSRSHGEGWVALYEGRIAFARRELEAAEQIFSNAAHNADQVPKDMALLMLTLQQQASMALARKNAGEALQITGNLEECIPATHRGLWRGHVHVLRAHSMLLYKMPQKACREVQQSRTIFEQYGYLLGIRMLDAWVGEHL